MNRALLVGINQFIIGNNLRGCVNDLESMRSLLVGRGWSPLHIHTLQDHSATRDAILVALKSMVSQAQEGDHLVFHYSGHGSQVPDQLFGGDETEDGLDEVLCPHDFDFAGIYIRDDDLKKIVSKFKGDSLDIFLDCCHSGTGIRNDDVSRCIPYTGPMPISRSWHPRHLLKGLDMGNVALWAGCRDTQTSADAFIDGKYQGAFTYYLVDAITKLKRYDATIRHEVLRQILMHIRNYDQTPQLEASDEMKNREIFS